MMDIYHSAVKLEMAHRKVFANSFFSAQLSFVETEKELCFH